MASRESPTFTSTTCTPCPFIASAMRCRAGISSRQGTHHTAQKFSTTRLPRNAEASKRVPSMFSNSSFGGGAGLHAWNSTARGSAAGSALGSGLAFGTADAAAGIPDVRTSAAVGRAAASATRRPSSGVLAESGVGTPPDGTCTSNARVASRSREYAEGAELAGTVTAPCRWRVRRCTGANSRRGPQRWGVR